MLVDPVLGTMTWSDWQRVALLALLPLAAVAIDRATLEERASRCEVRTTTVVTVTSDPTIAMTSRPTIDHSTGFRRNRATGPRRALVGAVTAEIRSYYPPEPYKGKGVRIVGERVRRKEGKTVA